jgi:hypothetical protein
MATTATNEVPQPRWQKFFDDFSQQHQGWRVLIEVEGKDLGDQEEVTGKPFQGISYVTAGTGAGNIEIGFGDKPNDVGSHFVDQPRQVFVADTDGGAESDVEIKGADGVTTLVRLRRDASFPSEDRPG